MQYRRRKRRLAIHAGVYVIVNGFSIGQWLLLRDEPIEDVDPRVLESFWPVWLMLLWGAILGSMGCTSGRASPSSTFRRSAPRAGGRAERSARSCSPTSSARPSVRRR
jgi:hypothetical protein